jgi:hypothetical protein
LGLDLSAGEDLPPSGTEPAANDPAQPASTPKPVPPKAPTVATGKPLSEAQQRTIERLVIEVDVEMPRLLEYYGVRSLAEIQVADFLRVVRSLEKRRAA